MKRYVIAAASVALLGACDAPFQLPLASDDAAGVAYWRCDQMAVAIVGDENDLFRQIYEREQLRRRCLSGEMIAVQNEVTPAAADPAPPESAPRPAGAMPPPPMVPRR